MLPPRGIKIFAKSLAQSYLVLSDKLVCFNQKLYGLAAKWFPGVLPLRHDKRSLTARGPFLFRARFAARLRSRLERIFCVLLRLSERSRTIEVRVTTLSAQNLRKIFRSMLRDYVYLIGSMPTFNNLVALI